MIRHAAPGQSVEFRYRTSIRHAAGFHGRMGRVRIVPRGPGPRNYGIEIDGRIVVVPAGNLALPVPATRPGFRQTTLFDRGGGGL